MKIKPEKPYEKFPLFPHATGRWAKKIKGKHVYFGPWNDWEGALERFHNYAKPSRFTFGGSVVEYLTSRSEMEEVDKITARHLTDIRITLSKVVKSIGARKILSSIESREWGRWRRDLERTNKHVSVAGHLRRLRAFLRWAEREKIANFPLTDQLHLPTRKELRRERSKRPAKLFMPEEIKRIMPYGGQLKAMILLGLNAGLGPNELAHMDHSHVENGWLVYPRSKTGVERRVPLWKETLAELPEGEGDQPVFVTQRGNRWTGKKDSGANPISQAFLKRCKEVKAYKAFKGFYSLRHTCATIGQESGDPAAIEYILGHAADPNDMAHTYRERMTDSRLLRVVNHVHEWLYET